MSIKQISPYLNFNGNATEAIKLYETVLGAKSDNVMRFGDMPGGGDMPADLKVRIAHAVLHLGGGIIQISDTPPDKAVALEGNAHVSLDCDDVVEMRRQFDGLAAGGKITMPLADMFWGATFGMLTDRFGVRWMFNCQKPKS